MSADQGAAIVEGRGVVSVSSLQKAMSVSDRGVTIVKDQGVAIVRDRGVAIVRDQRVVNVKDQRVPTVRDQGVVSVSAQEVSITKIRVASVDARGAKRNEENGETVRQPEGSANASLGVGRGSLRGSLRGRRTETMGKWAGQGRHRTTASRWRRGSWRD